jgi:hypothetical protein
MRIAAQPHRAQPPYIHEPTANATETFPTLSAKFAMDRRPLTPVHGRRLVFCRQQRRSFTTLGPRRVPTRPPRTRTQSQERPLGAYTNMRAPRTQDRHHNLYFPSPSLEASSHCYALPNPIATLCTRRPLATCPTTRKARRKSAVPLPRHSSRPLLPPRTARRPRYAHMMGRTGTTHLPTKRDLQWWTQVPSANNGRSIFSPIETAYLQCDNSSYGWGVVLNEQLEARGFWSAADQQQHINRTELKAVRLAVLSFLPLLRG